MTETKLFRLSDFPKTKITVRLVFVFISRSQRTLDRQTNSLLVVDKLWLLICIEELKKIFQVMTQLNGPCNSLFEQKSLNSSLVNKSFKNVLYIFSKFVLTKCRYLCWYKQREKE